MYRRSLIIFLSILDILYADIYNITLNKRIYEFPHKKNTLYVIEKDLNIYKQFHFLPGFNNCFIMNKYYLVCKYIPNSKYDIIINEVDLNDYTIKNKYFLHYIFNKNIKSNIVINKKNFKNKNNYKKNTSSGLKYEYTNPKIETYTFNNFYGSNTNKEEITHIPDDVEVINMDKIPHDDLVVVKNNNENNSKRIIKDKKAANILYKKEQRNKKNNDNIIETVFTFEKIFDINNIKKILNINYYSILNKINQKIKFTEIKIVDTFNIPFKKINNKYRNYINSFIKIKIIPVFDVPLKEIENSYKNELYVYKNKLLDIFNFEKSIAYKKYLNKIKLIQNKILQVFNINYKILKIEYFYYYKLKNIFNIKNIKLIKIKTKKIKVNKKKNNKINTKLINILKENFTLENKKDFMGNIDKNIVKKDNKDNIKKLKNSNKKTKLNIDKKLLNILKENFNQ